MTAMRKSLCVLLAMVLAVSAFSGCTVQQNPDADDGKLHVVTTIFAPYDFARQVGGDDVSVTMLLRAGCGCTPMSRRRKTSLPSAMPTCSSTSAASRTPGSRPCLRV
ncbi:MAG: hypothetical protein ACLSHG_10640 [Oscillospiraceae bacterium]